MQDLVNKIHCIDAMELLYSLPDASIDMVLCDLPYGVTDCAWDTIIPIEPMWKELRRVVKKRSAIVLTATQPFTSRLVSSNYEMFRYEWVWTKNAGSNFALVKLQPMKKHESVIVFSKEKCNYYPVMQERAESGKKRVENVVNYNTKTAVYGNKLGEQVSSKRPVLRYPSSVQKFNRERGFHPSQKPVTLFEYLIRTYTLEGETVLDMTCGSGTTAVAAKNLGRNFICGDTDPHYVEIARHRVEYGEEATVKKYKKKQDNNSEKSPTDSTTTLFDLI